MKKIYKSIILCLLSLFIIGATVPVESHVAEKMFIDVKQTDTYYPYISRLIDLGIVSQGSETKFRPNCTISRSEFLTYLCRAINIDETNGEASFSDTKNHWAKGYIEAALQKNIIDFQNSWSHTDKIVFRPDAAISKYEATEMMCRALNLEPCNSEKFFVDYSNGYPITAYQEFLLANSFSSINGEKRYFSSDDVSRGEAAKLIVNVIEYKKNPIEYKERMSKDKDYYLSTYTGFVEQLMNMLNQTWDKSFDEYNADIKMMDKATQIGLVKDSYTNKDDLPYYNRFIGYEYNSTTYLGGGKNACVLTLSDFCLILSDYLKLKGIAIKDYSKDYFIEASMIDGTYIPIASKAINEIYFCGLLPFLNVTEGNSILSVDAMEPITIDQVKQTLELLSFPFQRPNIKINQNIGSTKKEWEKTIPKEISKQLISSSKGLLGGKSVYECNSYALKKMDTWEYVKAKLKAPSTKFLYNEFINKAQSAVETWINADYRKIDTIESNFKENRSNFYLLNNLSNNIKKIKGNKFVRKGYFYTSKELLAIDETEEPVLRGTIKYTYNSPSKLKNQKINKWYQEDIEVYFILEDTGLKVRRWNIISNRKYKAEGDEDYKALDFITLWE